jgi:hypothetical protein
MSGSVMRISEEEEDDEEEEDIAGLLARHRSDVRIQIIVNFIIFLLERFQTFKSV